MLSFFSKVVISSIPSISTTLLVLAGDFLRVKLTTSTPTTLFFLTNNDLGFTGEAVVGGERDARDEEEEEDEEEGGCTMGEEMEEREEERDEGEEEVEKEEREEYMAA